MSNLRYLIFSRLGDVRVGVTIEAKARFLQIFFLVRVDGELNILFSSL